MKYIKTLTIFILVLLSIKSNAQCAGTTSFTLTPTPPSGGYTPGTLVTVCFTMSGYTQVGSNWFEGFDINLGPGWTSLTPLTAPANCGGSSTGGQWIWVNSVTSTTTPITTVGPGYFFDLNTDGNPGNDFGDNNTGGCVWTMCFRVTVASSCTPQNLLIQVTPGSDGVWGSFTSTSCDATTPITVYNGNTNPTPIIVGPISHN